MRAVAVSIALWATASPRVARADVVPPIELVPVEPTGPAPPRRPLTPAERDRLLVDARRTETTGWVLAGTGIATASATLIGELIVAVGGLDDSLHCSLGNNQACAADGTDREIALGVGIGGMLVGGALMIWGFNDIHQARVERRHARLLGVSPVVSSSSGGFLVTGSF